MMNIAYVITLCLLSLLVGFELGCWKKDKAVRKMADELTAIYNKDIQMIVDKILKSRKDNKGGE